MTSRNWLFTLNNPDIDEYPELWNKDHLTLIVYQMEKGIMGTLHLQGYLEINSPRRLSFVQSLNGRAHWEIRRGTRMQALQYCTKEDTSQGLPLGWSAETPESWYNCDRNNIQDFYQKLHLTNLATPPVLPKEKRLTTIQSLLSSNSVSIEQIADDEFDLWVRYFRAFEKYVCMKTKPRKHPVEVHVIVGPTGTGKSRWAMENYPEAYWKQRSKWWDGYFKHESVVIDEFYGWIPFDLLLRLLDRYPLLVESKGGQIQFVAKTIVITSNSFPDKWYKSCDIYLESLLRRISKYHYMPSIGVHVECETWEKFKSYDK